MIIRSIKDGVLVIIDHVLKKHKDSILKNLRCHDCDEALTDETVFYVKISKSVSVHIATSAPSSTQQRHQTTRVGCQNRRDKKRTERTSTANEQQEGSD